jgi:hypothetical protein
MFLFYYVCATLQSEKKANGVFGYMQCTYQRVRSPYPTSARSTAMSTDNTTGQSANAPHPATVSRTNRQLSLSWLQPTRGALRPSRCVGTTCLSTALTLPSGPSTKTPYPISSKLQTPGACSHQYTRSRGSGLANLHSHTRRFPRPHPYTLWLIRAILDSS